VRPHAVELTNLILKQEKYMRRPFGTLAVIAGLLIAAPSLWAKTFYLKNGEEIECQSYRQQGDRMYVQINNETRLDFALDEVDFKKTPKIKPGNKDRKVKQSADTNVDAKAIRVTELTDPLPEGTTWWKAGDTPDDYQPGTPQLQEELSAIYAKYNEAAQSGDFNQVARYMPEHQAKRSMELLAKVKDKKERQLRKKTLQEMAVKDFSGQKCAVSPDGTIAALAGKGKAIKGSKYQEAKGTVKFLKENGSWKVAFQIW
jgi:hypothetical protein